MALTNNVWLRWNAPTNCGMSNNLVYIRYATNRYPTTMSDGTQIYTGSTLAFEHTGVDSSGWVTNYYTIWGNNGSSYASLGNNVNGQGCADPGKARMIWTGLGGEVYSWNLKATGSKKSGGSVLTGLLSPANYWTARGFNDIDQDGIADLLWTGAGGEVVSWLMNADGTLRVSRSVSGNLSPANYWTVRGFADIDRDATADILWTGASGEVVCWFLNANGTLKASRSVSGNLSPVNYWTACGFSDIDRDGTADILWTGAGGEVVCWLLNANGTLKGSRSVSGNLSPANYWTVVGFRDVDRDGTADILWTGGAGEVVRWLLNINGTLKSSRSVAGNLLPVNYWTVRGFRDIDGDGTTDILWYGSGGETYYWLLDINGAYRSGGQINPGSVTPGYWNIRAVGSNGR